MKVSIQKYGRPTEAATCTSLLHTKEPANRCGLLDFKMHSSGKSVDNLGILKYLAFVTQGVTAERIGELHIYLCIFMYVYTYVYIEEHQSYQMIESNSRNEWAHW